jgi:ethanolamine permease
VSTPSTSSDAGASTGTDASAYLARRRLRTGAAGWVLLAGLGVSYVISGTAPAGTSAWPKAVSAAC